MTSKTASETPREHTMEVVVTSIHPSAAGDIILIGRDKFENLVRALVPGRLFADSPREGETWRISGSRRVHPVYGDQTYATVALPLLPSGKSIVRFLAVNPRFVGVGWATAELLWTRFGIALYDTIQSADVATLASVCGIERAATIVAEFAGFAENLEVFKELDKYGTSPQTAGAAARLWGRAAIAKIKSNPYSLTLLEPWSSVDDQALRMGVLKNDARRLVAGAEQALTTALKKGHMLLSRKEALRATQAVIGSGADPRRALHVAIESGLIVNVAEDSLQLRGCEFMEREIERQIGLRLKLARKVESDSILTTLRNLAALQRFELTDKQRDAVFMVASGSASILTGGAGTGKTAALRAIVECEEPIHDETSDARIRLVALSGRAARRMALATRKEAWTLARLLTAFDTGVRMEEGLIVFDEASMLDTPNVYRVLSKLGEDVRVLFVGDPGQLPPIGPGLPFQKLVTSPHVPQVKLDLVHRQAENTGIPFVASAIRHGSLPTFQTFDFAFAHRPGVFLVPCRTGDVPTAVRKVFRAMVGPPPRAGFADALWKRDVQIVTQINSGPAGARDLSRDIESEFMVKQVPVEDWGFHEGSRLIWLKNDYRKAPVVDAKGKAVIDPTTGEPRFNGFFNGSLGIPRLVDGRCLLSLDDGSSDFITRSDVEKLALGWAITIHKAQGSSFDTVIVPITPSPLLDRTMLYTAVTRAENTAVLVGDPDLIRETIESVARTTFRGCGLVFHIEPEAPYLT
ncbi:exodeoxyribonuclease V alpha subunit [Rhizobium skierniewicense]|uniref:Exodeoxyribonuclease V alpha subunit n=1 Tax=Rhizobium skierniewicense TaxID=984260 RepID=A0A7W6C9M2_9HYPH|nr:AAA family ATPase [Rhizobium skierniewicense]MBB3946974.1 exodeoxyribonuclease V alpha subunit [Rhizobium skierniewicense]